MYAIVRSGPGEVQLNFMWLPAFIAYDVAIKKRIEEKLGPQLVGKDLTEDTLQWAHEQALDIICEVHKALPGLRDYLDAMKFVQDQPSTG